MREKLKNFGLKYYLTLIAFIVAGSLTLLIESLFLQRTMAIAQIKKQIYLLDTSLQEIGYDFAYDDLSFSPFYPFAIARAENFRILSTNPNNYYEWSTSELKLSGGLFNTGNISINLGSKQYFQRGEKRFEYTIGESQINLKFAAPNGLKQWIIKLKNLNIKDVADIEEINLASRRMAPQQINELSPFFENYLELKNITLNGLLDYPLSQKINRIYLNANLMGVIKEDVSFRSRFESWVQLGGSLDIKNLVVNWPPFLIVGRGDFYFNERLEPNLHLNTSSKALFDLMNELGEKKVLDSKGIFVAKILLNNKAFKLNKDDKYYTVTTPIDYRDGKLSIENITVKSTKKK